MRADLDLCKVRMNVGWLLLIALLLGSSCRTVQPGMNTPVSSVKALYNDEYILALRRVVLQGDKYIKFEQIRGAQLKTDAPPVFFMFEVCHQQTYRCINPFLDDASQPVVFTGTIQELPQSQRGRDHDVTQQLQLLHEAQARAPAGSARLGLDGKLKRGAVVILSMASGLLTGQSKLRSGGDEKLERWMLQSSLGLDYIVTHQEKELIHLENELRQDIVRQAQQSREHGGEAELNLERATVAVHFEQLQLADPEFARAITSPYMILVIQALGQLVNSLYVKEPPQAKTTVAQICIPEVREQAEKSGGSGLSSCYPIDSKVEQLL